MKTKIQIYTDFDGTITSKPGGQTVFLPFYQSLLVGYQTGLRQDYKKISMHSPNALQSLFEKEFGKYIPNHTSHAILMNQNAVNFFHETLKQDNVTINIVTRNRKEYIIAMFRYQGFLPEEIEKMTIMQSGRKREDVSRHLLLQRANKPTHILILDDDKSDFTAMMQAAQTKIDPEKQVLKGIHNPPGTFDWISHQTLINQWSGMHDNQSRLTPLRLKDGFFAQKNEEIAPDVSRKRLADVMPLEEQNPGKKKCPGIHSQLDLTVLTGERDNLPCDFVF